MIKDFNKIAIIAGEHEVSYSEMLCRINDFAQHTPKEKDARTLVFAENREGWIYAFFSIWANGGSAVPVDASSTVHDVAYILNDCHPSCVWTSKANEETTRQAMAEAQWDVPVLLIDDFEQREVGQTQATIHRDNDETALIIYTSGTTGSPKGVMLSFGNLMANMHGVADEVPIFNEERRTLILLPLHHVLPLMGTVIVPILRGGGVAICPTMTAADIMGTLCKGKIAIMIGVPRLWQTLYHGIKKKIDASFVTRFLFSMCATFKCRALSRFVFQSVRKKMGGHIDYCVSGGAALDKEIGEGMRTLGLDVLEGYGMTETAPIISFTRPGDIIPGCAGLPLPSVECKLVNGELCAKGPNVMQGYYNRPEETAAVIDKDGFIHTGDLAELDEKGRVIITGRTKEIIVLSNGKNVQPNEIEYKLECYPERVKEAAVVQDGDMLRAIIVPVTEWAKDLSDAEVEETLKREVLEPYNRTVTNYKKLMSLFVYRGDLPRTKLDKLQRFKLKDILSGAQKAEQESAPIEEPKTEEYQILKQYIESEKGVKMRPTDHIETDLGLDSLDKVGLQSFIEQTFGTELNADAMASFANMAEMAARIAESKTRMEVETVDWNQVLSKDSSSLSLPTTSPFMPLGYKMFKLWFRIYNRLSISGRENIPAQGPYILAPNHQSYVDSPILMSGLKWGQIHDCFFYATEEHVQSGFRRFMARRNNIIVMSRSDLKNSILRLAQVLKSGKNIAIFPEGSRTHTGELGEFKKTYAILAQELGVPVVPVCIRGAYDALPRGHRFLKPKKIRVQYLPAVTPVEGQSYEQLSDTVKQHISDCLHQN